MPKVALVVIFNHRYDKNIPVLREYLSSRFSLIRFMVPFYDGNDNDIIPVYHNSRLFQGYLATSHPVLNHLNVDHYIFVADDMVMNPLINEDNYCDILKIGEYDNFISDICPLHENQKWTHYTGALNFKLKQIGIEVDGILPSAIEALAKLKDYRVKLSWKESSGRDVNLLYPLLCGYSDFFVINKVNLTLFCRYCGVLAGLGLFVEVAIPTALSLVSLFNVKTISNSGLGLYSGAIWTSDEIQLFHEKYEGNFYNLVQNFPVNKLYVHPIKLSKWSI